MRCSSKESEPPTIPGFLSLPSAKRPTVDLFVSCSSCHDLVSSSLAAHGDLAEKLHAKNGESFWFPT